MNKIPTVFKRDPDDRKHVVDEVTPSCEWVFAGEGVATRKYDGTCVMFDGADWWNRREIRAGKQMPLGAIDLGVDENTGKHMCWVPNSPAGFQRFLEIAIANYGDEYPKPGTYELCGPKIDTRAGSNPEGLDDYVLYRHDEAPVVELNRIDFEYLKGALDGEHAYNGAEGVVWHHPDGRMAKLKYRDFWS